MPSTHKRSFTVDVTDALHDPWPVIEHLERVLRDDLADDPAMSVWVFHEGGHIKEDTTTEARDEMRRHGVDEYNTIQIAVGVLTDRQIMAWFWNRLGARTYEVEVTTTDVLFAEGWVAVLEKHIRRDLVHGAPRTPMKALTPVAPSPPTPTETAPVVTTPPPQTQWWRQVPWKSVAGIAFAVGLVFLEVFVTKWFT